MMTKVIQIVSVEENSTMTGTEVRVIEKIGEPYEEYQLHLKQYYFNVKKFNSEIEECFSLILGKSIPAMEQFLAGEKGFNNIKETSEYITLINMIERI